MSFATQLDDQLGYTFPMCAFMKCLRHLDVVTSDAVMFASLGENETCCCQQHQRRDYLAACVLNAPLTRSSRPADSRIRVMVHYYDYY